jgi:glyceraldehyde 3-phosphate dehydrogenase
MFFLGAVQKTATTAEEINAAFKNAAAGSLKDYLGVTDEPLVSVDFLGDPRSGIVDLLSTKVIDGTLAKVIAWYDNEWGYSCRLVDLAKFVAK